MHSSQAMRCPRASSESANFRNGEALPVDRRPNRRPGTTCRGPTRAERMFADEIRRAIEAASRITLPQVTALLWRAYGEGKLTETEAESLSGLIEARTLAASNPRLGKLLTSATSQVGVVGDALQDRVAATQESGRLTAAHGRVAGASPPLGGLRAATAVARSSLHPSRAGGVGADCGRDHPAGRLPARRRPPRGDRRCG